MIELEWREAGRCLHCTCLLCCVMIQIPRSTVNSYYQCCFCWALCRALEPLDTWREGTSPQSSLCPHWLCQQVSWKGPHPCGSVKPFVVGCPVAFEKDVNNFPDSCGHSEAARKKLASMEQSLHTAEIGGQPVVSLLANGVGCFSQPRQ